MNHSHELNIGRAGQYLVLCDLLLRGHQAYETAEGCNYDVVVDLDGTLVKLQVKTTLKMRMITQRSNPIYFFHIKRTGKGGLRFYKQRDFDGFALVALDRRAVFYILFDDKIKSSSICIRDKEIDYTGNNGGYRPGRYFQDMTWEKFIECFLTRKKSK